MSKYQNLKQHIELGESVSSVDLLFLNPYLLKVLAFITVFAFRRKLRFCLTSIIRSIEENENADAESLTHVQARAFDFSIVGWSKKDMKDLERELKVHFDDIAAIAFETMLPRIIKFHDNGNGPHGHVQIRPNL